MASDESTGFDLDAKIEDFLAGEPHAVVGASRDRAKYGNKVLRVYQQTQRPVFPVNPAGGEVEGLEAYPSLSAIPQTIYGVSIITPPAVTEQVVAEAIELGVMRIWMQPGAESDEAIRRAEDAGATVIAGGACILVVLGYHEH